MNLFALLLGLVPSIVKGIQQTVGDSKSGATKAQMAHDALSAATNAASGILTGNNAVYGEVASQVAQVAIDQTVAIAQADGSYAKWTAAANAAQQDAAIGKAVGGVIQAVQGQPVPLPAQAGTNTGIQSSGAQKIE